MTQYNKGIMEGLVKLCKIIVFDFTPNCALLALYDMTVWTDIWRYTENVNEAERWDGGVKN